MKYHSYICDTCGFISEEKIGEYQCPRCGSKLRFARKVVETVSKQKEGPIISLSMASCALIFIPFIGIFLAPIAIFLVWYVITVTNRNNAIRLHSTAVLNKPWVQYTCNSCGNIFKGQRGNCPYCGATLTYND